ncbi:MAG: 2'-5' RNA ligase family protein [Candidatus Tectimicrobiota bacterium]
MPAKTHHTAVIAMPPPEVWEPIQAIRRQYDRQITRWMPHVNLLYPFWPREQFTAALPLLQAVGAGLAPFQACLTTVQSFTHARGRATLWLTPEPREAFVALQAALQAAFPDCQEQGRFARGFTPHLSVGQADSAAERQQLLPRVQALWQPLAFRLEAVQLIWRQADGPFQVAQTIPLGPPGV